jgi:membrane-anchored mycosin MYCP
MGVPKAAAAVAAVLAAVPALPAPAQARRYTACAAPGQVGATPPGRTGAAAPYEDRLYDLARLAPLADGSGVRVAVVDSGVDPGHPQLRGRVAAGRDYLRGNPDGRQDCVGHGTAVASIIAARPAGGVAFHGLAPGATIVPVRISEQEEIAGRAVGVRGSSADFARAIDWAADPAGGDAQVINLSLATTRDDPRVRRAVRRAVARGVVVVAAVGNDGEPARGNPTPYPAAYPDVIGVGAIGADGSRAPYSQHGAYVDVMAAGDRVTVAAPPAGHTRAAGTSYAAPFVAATAALLRQRFPTLSPAQVARRIIATADPAPGGRRSDGYGYGLLNPYRALTEGLGPVSAAPPAAVAVPTADPATAAVRARRARARDRAVRVAGGGAGAVLAAGTLAAAARRGRRRGWRPAGRGDA